MSGLSKSLALLELVRGKVAHSHVTRLTGGNKKVEEATSGYQVAPGAFATFRTWP